MDRIDFIDKLSLDGVKNDKVEIINTFFDQLMALYGAVNILPIEIYYCNNSEDDKLEFSFPISSIEEGERYRSIISNRIYEVYGVIYIPIVIIDNMKIIVNLIEKACE